MLAGKQVLASFMPFFGKGETKAGNSIRKKSRLQERKVLVILVATIHWWLIFDKVKSYSKERGEDVMKGVEQEVLFQET